MAEQQSIDTIQGLFQKVADARAELQAAVHQAHGSDVPRDYAFGTGEGEVTLSELFGGHDDLLVIHNMGRSCSYCSLWADGLASLHPKITERASIALSSPDAPDVQAEVAQRRGWPYRMVSVAGNTFAEDMGFKSERGYLPGVSAFHKNEDGSITRSGSAYFGPGDDFCAIWPLFDLLEGGAKGWEPR
ncbi:MAG: DUF899 family protein [Planctomycetota bacterium]